MLDGRDGAGPAKGRRPPWGLLGMVGLVVLIESTLAGHDLDFTAPWHWDWRVTGHWATRTEQVGGRDVLLFGDSLVKFGLMPEVIRQGSGRTVLNLGLHTGQASSSYFLLERALLAGARPSAIVLDLTPHLLSQAPATNAHLWSELLSTGESLDLATTMRDPDFFASTMLGRVLTSFKERPEIRANVLAALAGKTSSRRYEIPIYRRNWKVNDGAQLMGDAGAPAIDPDVWINALYTKWSPHPVNVAYLDRFLALAASRQVPVYWLLPPIHPAVQARIDASRFDRAHSAFVRGVQARFPGTVVVDARHSGFTPDLFTDGVHLNRRGALELSAAIAGSVLGPVGAEGPNRWVALDLSRARPVDYPMEDVNRSGVALRAERIAARR